MANLTITIDDALLRRARVRAVEAGTSVNAVLREHLRAWVGGVEERQRAAAALVARSARSRSARAGATWTRDELHER